MTKLRHLPIYIALTTGIFASGVAHAFSDDEARKAILELRERIEQDRRVRLDFAEQIEILKQEVASLRGQVEQMKWAAGMTNTNHSGSHQNIDPQELAVYEVALELFNNTKYAEAVASLETFLQSYPDSQLAPEAMFYRGSALYATNNFNGSIQGLKELIQQHPNNDRSADALLVIAASLIELDNISGAREALKTITSNYPDSSAASTAQERLKLLE